MTATRLVITGTWVTETDTPASGRIQFQANDIGFVNGGEMVRAGVQGYALDKTGSISVSLIRCPDGYTVTEQINGAYKRSYILPDQAGPVDLRDVIITPTGTDPAALVAAEAVLRQQGDIAEGDARESQLASEASARVAGDAASAAALSALEAELPGVYAPIAEIDDRIAGDAALDTRVDALEAGGGSTGNAKLTANCLNFPHVDDDQQLSPNVSHGPFFLPGPMGYCLWEAWLMPRAAGGRYWLSDGYGGAHASLYGFSYDATSGINSLQGNTYFAGGSNNSAFFSDADEGLYNGEWGYTAFGWDGTNICGWVNGIPVFLIPLTGRDTGGIGGTGNLNIGGSDHLNFDGHLAQVRGFEGSCPVNMGQAYTPDFPFFSMLHGVLGYAKSQFLADYQTPSAKIISDLSDGFNGQTHPGTMRNPYGFHGYPGGIQGPNWVNDPTMPFQAEGLVLPAEKTWATPSTPVGAVNFDPFSRRNQTYAFQEKPSLGMCPSGSAGIQEWLPRHPQPGHGDPTFGILAGRAVPLAPGGSSVSYLPGNGSANMDVQVSRKGPSGKAGVTQTGIAFRVVDPGDPDTHPTQYWYCYQYGGAMYLGNTTDGLLINGISLPNPNYHVQRVVATGTSISLYVDDGAGGWTQVGTTQTSTRFQAATRAGLYSVGGDGLSRFDNFTRLAA